MDRRPQANLVEQKGCNKRAAVLMHEEEKQMSAATMKDNVLEMEIFNYDKSQHSDAYTDNLSELSTDFMNKICDSIAN